MISQFGQDEKRYIVIKSTKFIGKFSVYDMITGDEIPCHNYATAKNTSIDKNLTTEMVVGDHRRESIGASSSKCPLSNVLIGCSPCWGAAADCAKDIDAIGAAAPGNNSSFSNFRSLGN